MSNIINKIRSKISPPIFIILCLSTIFFYPALFQDKTFYPFDTLFDYLPWTNEAVQHRAHNTLITDSVNVFYRSFNFLKKCLDQRILPFWDPNIFCGLKTSPTGHPLAFVSYLCLPQLTAHDFLLWLHLTFAGIFMFFYLREVGLKKYPAIIGTVAWMFNGYVMVWFEFENVIIMAPTLPAALLFLERWLKDRKAVHFLLLTCAVSLAITNGSAQLNIYQLFFLGIYGLYKCIILRNNDLLRPFSKQDVITVFAAILLTTSISSLFLFKHLSFLEDPQRGEFSFRELFENTGRLPAKYMTTLIFPDFFGTPAGERNTFTPNDNGALIYNNYNELCIYSGILPVFLLFACIPYLGKKENVSLYFLTALTTLSLAGGSLLYYPFAKFIPGLNMSTASRVLYIFGFSMAVLAAFGAEILIETGGNTKKKTILILWSLLLIAIILIVLYVQTETGIKWAADSFHWDNPEQVLRIMKKHFSVFSPIIIKPLCIVFLSIFIITLTLLVKNIKLKNVFLSISIIILSYDLISFGVFYNTASPKHLEFPETGAIRFLKKDKSAYRIATHGNFMHNSFSPFNIQDIGGYHSFYPKRYGEYLHLAQNAPDTPFPDTFSRWTNFTDFTSPLLDIINTKYILVSPEVSIVSMAMKLVYNDEIKIYENKNAFPRAFFVPSYELCQKKECVYRHLSGFSLEDFQQKVILESDPPNNFHQSIDIEASSPSKINITSYKPDYVEIAIKTNCRGFLVLSDNFHPDWEARVDGEKVQILRANYIMRAIPVKQGFHQVVFKFRPKLLILGGFITLFGWIVLAFLIVNFWWRENKNKKGC